MVFITRGRFLESHWTPDPCPKKSSGVAAYDVTVCVRARFRRMNHKYEAARAQWEKSAAATHPGAAATTRAATPPDKPTTKTRQPLHSGPIPPVHPGEMESPLVYGYKFGDLYDLIVRPVIPYAIRGVLWDQGEGGTGVLGVEQYPLMGALIHNWRQDWGQGDFPFIYFQKPSGGGCAWDLENPVTQRADKFAEIPRTAQLPGGLNRENYIRIMQYPNTAMVIASDLEAGVHPANKTGYATRACRVAMGMVYGSKIDYYGPIYQSHKIEGNAIRITFTHVGKGLGFCHGDKVQGFAIAGDDKKFIWADAVIDGAAAVVSSPKIPHPAAVRYAWGNNSIGFANLFNKDGLPALAFRTDAWPQ